MSPKTKKFRDLVAPLDADPEHRAAIEAEKQLTMTAIGLAELRRGAGLSQEQLAKRLGVSQENVSRIERAEDTQLSTMVLRLLGASDCNSRPVVLSAAEYATLTAAAAIIVWGLVRLASFIRSTPALVASVAVLTVPSGGEPIVQRE